MATVAKYKMSDAHLTLVWHEGGVEKTMTAPVVDACMTYDDEYRTCRMDILALADKDGKYAYFKHVRSSNRVVLFDLNAETLDAAYAAAGVDRNKNVKISPIDNYYVLEFNNE